MGSIYGKSFYWKSNRGEGKRLFPQTYHGIELHLHEPDVRFYSGGLCILGPGIPELQREFPRMNFPGVVNNAMESVTLTLVRPHHFPEKR